MNNNCNPLNIKWANPNDHDDKWVGSSGYDSRGHAIFDDPVYGIRAAMRSMQKKWRNGKQTLRAICRDWAPESDTQGSIEGNPQNNPDEQAHYVAARVFISPTDILPEPANIPLWANILSAMARFEMGESCPYTVIKRGVAKWATDFLECGK